MSWLSLKNNAVDTECIKTISFYFFAQYRVFFLYWNTSSQWNLYFAIDNKVVSTKCLFTLKYKLLKKLNPLFRVLSLIQNAYILSLFAFSCCFEFFYIEIQVVNVTNHLQVVKRTLFPLWVVLNLFAFDNKVVNIKWIKTISLHFFLQFWIAFRLKYT